MPRDLLQFSRWRTFWGAPSLSAGCVSVGRLRGFPRIFLWVWGAYWVKIQSPLQLCVLCFFPLHFCAYGTGGSIMLSGV